MQKRNIALVAVVILAVAAVGVILYALSRPTLAPTTYVAAKATPASSKCLEQSATLAVIEGRDAMEQAAISYLTDVPAGTNVDVKIASFSEDAVTGSARYPAKYGNYNFTLTKQGGSWQVTGFEHCKI
jgi:hypothetical protein